jgi:hypothetical protein
MSTLGQMTLTTAWLEQTPQKQKPEKPESLKACKQWQGVASRADIDPSPQ